MLSNSVPDDPEKWLESATPLNGSWWNSWNKWLSANSGNLVKAIDYNSLPIIEPAPGSYVK